MAIPRKRKAPVENSPLTVVLIDTRLKKIAVEILIPVEEAGAGAMKLSYNISAPVPENLDIYAALLQIEGNGFIKKDPSKVAFTFDAEMIGIFSLSRQPSDDELKDKVSICVANYIAPVLSDTLETAMIKAGYPRLKIPKSFPPSSVQSK